MNVTSGSREAFAALASHLAERRDQILSSWREAVERDPELTTANAISRAKFNDHIPEVLDAFEKELCVAGVDGKVSARAEEQHKAAEHGLQRWQQGYDQRETMREWGHLHLCLLEAVEEFGALHPGLDVGVMTLARRALVRMCNTAVCESAARFTLMQRTDAANRVKELESALQQLAAIERQRAEAWREAAHDLRGSVSVISSAAAILNRENMPESVRSSSSRILRKGVASLHDLLSDLMSLARLEAGHDRRNLSSFDVASLMREFCDALRPLASERGLFLRCEGPEGLLVTGDSAKVRRIAQNLVLNALNITEQGGVVVSWQENAATGSDQWMLCVQDSGPGFREGSEHTVSGALQHATAESHEVDQRAESTADPAARVESLPLLASRSPARAGYDLPGEGIGLSIVKRLCELLDAGMEIESAAGRGTTIRVTFPRVYLA